MFSATGVNSLPSTVIATNQAAKLVVLKATISNNQTSLVVRQVMLVEVQVFIISGSILPNVRVSNHFTMICHYSYLNQVDAVIVSGPENAQLDDSESSATTNSNGIATFELIFVAGLPGNAIRIFLKLVLNLCRNIFYPIRI